MNTTVREIGAVHPLVIATAVLGVLTVSFGGVGVWAYMNYLDQKNNTDAKIASAVEQAEAVQAQELEKAFVEREKKPFRQFVGPDDLGRVTFDYPKTWSVHVAANEGNTYEAYLNPGVVPPISRDQAYATRVIIQDRGYDTVLKSYDGFVRRGDLKSSPVKVNGADAIRLDGTFQNDIKGSAVILKVRDKALTLFTDAESFQKDFNTIILKSLKFNP